MIERIMAERDALRALLTSLAEDDRIPMCIRADIDQAAHHISASPEEVRPDTLPQWLFERFGRGTHSREWDRMPQSDQQHWAHEAAAVRLAVLRNGFKKE